MFNIFRYQGFISVYPINDLRKLCFCGVKLIRKPIDSWSAWQSDHETFEANKLHFAFYNTTVTS